MSETPADAEREARDQACDMEHYVTHVLGPDGGDTQTVFPDDYWLCFQCGEKFTPDQEDEARRHFGVLPPSMPGVCGVPFDLHLVPHNARYGSATL